MRTKAAEARALIEEAQAIVVISHERPDGDGVGSLLGLSLALEVLGKKVTPVLADGMPRRYGMLPGSERVVREVPSEASLIITVDCSELLRTGFPLQQFTEPPDINIDHHQTNTGFGKVNLVDAAASATAEILFVLAPDLGLPVTLEVATNLLAGLVADTIGFRTSNVTPDVLRVAADLVEHGASLSEVYHHMLNKRTHVAARYWGLGLSRLQMEEDLVWTSLTLEDRRRVGYPGPDDADLINLLSTIEGAEAAIIFVEQPGNRVKVSWRSQGRLDVSRVAEQFGGGGHAPAAGAMLEGDLETVHRNVLSATRALQKATSDLEIA